MSVVSLVNLFFISVAVRGTLTAEVCPHGFELYMGMCYHFSGGEETWIQALKSCMLFNSQLVEIDNGPKDEYLRNRSFAIGTNDYYWIGLSDKLIEGEYMWATSKRQISGEDYMNWGASEPDNKDENCVFLAPSRNYTWADGDCTREENYICEISPSGGTIVG